jgi:hypothetical protein
MLLIQLENLRVNLNLKGPYTFEFGTKELLNMIGLPPNEGNEPLNKMMKSTFVKLEQNKLTVQDVVEFSKHVSFIRKKLERDKEKEMV